MDYVDEQQAREETDGFEYNPNIAIQQAQRIQSNTRKFGEGVVTEDQVKDEMLFTMMNCSPCLERRSGANTNTNL